VAEEVSKAPGVARNTSVLPVSGIFPCGRAKAGRAEDRGAAHPRERRDAEAVVEAESIFKRRARAAVEAADDVRVEESMSALRAGLVGGVVLEGDAGGRQVRMARDGSRVISHFHDE